MARLIRAGTLITAAETFQADLLIEGEEIAQIGRNLTVPAGVEVVDAAGKLVMPGGVDVHTHFDLQMFDTVSSDDHFTGHRAAAYGGTTTVIDFIPQDFSPLLANVEVWKARVAKRAAVDYSFHMNISRLDEEVAAAIPHLVTEGITSIKVFTAYNNRLRLSDAGIFQALRIARDAGMLTMVHAENGDVIDLLVAEALAAGNTSPIWHARTRPAWGAVEAVLRACALAAQADAPLYVVHMNAGGEVDQLQYARQRGVKVMGETCPQYLFLTEQELEREDGAKFICSPPLRLEADRERLWQGLADGVLQVVATDHCPFFYNGAQDILFDGHAVRIAGKELGQANFTLIPNGLPGVGDRLPVMWSGAVGVGRMTANQFVQTHCTNPAKIFGMYPRKGSLTPGADADIVIWDPARRTRYGVEVARHRTDYNLYEGWELTGMPEKVFLRGNLIVDEGKWLGNAGGGRFLARVPFAPVI